MPVFLNGAAPTSAKPKNSLTKYYPLLTGKPTNTIGWFNTNYVTINDKMQSIIRAIDGLIVKNNGDVPEFKYSIPDEDAILKLISLTGDHLLLKKDVPGDYSMYDVYLIGFEKLRATVNYKQSNFLVPILYFKDTTGSSNMLFHASVIDPNEYADISTYEEVLKNITTQELFDQAHDFYFNKNMSVLLTDMPKIAKKKQFNDNDVLEAYIILKHYQAENKFNAVQLGAFVKEITKNSNDQAKLGQLLLQLPELTFASLSEQFEISSQAFPPLV